MQVQVYFGEGKGKTTAALGQALRSRGRGWRVLFVQFLKDSRESSGEVDALRRYGNGWKVLRSRLPCPTISAPSPEDRLLLRVATEKLLERALREVARGVWETVVLDEALAAWKLGLLRVAEIGRVRKTAAEAGTRLLVLTGRWAPKSLLAGADLVTEMRKVRHPYDRGEKARRGIDF